MIGINLPVVVYVHCGHGQDRTGEMAGAYLLQYVGISMQQIWSTNISIPIMNIISIYIDIL